MNTNSEILQVPLTQIIPNRFQPRTNFNNQELEELAASIKEHGIIQPLVLRKMGENYEIIAGERRFRAAGMVGLTTVPAIISNIDDQTSAEVALVENIQRSDLTPIEEARSYKNILDKGYLTQEQLAKKMGVSQPAIANKLRLLNLDESVQEALLAGKISERHARSLLGIPNKERQREWLGRIINERLTVRQLDIEIKKSDDLAKSDDIPLVSVNNDIESFKKNATDIPLASTPANNNSFFNFNPPTLENNPINNNDKEPTPASEPKKTPNKFFNFLEDEAVDMNGLSDGPSVFNNPSMPNNVQSEPNKFFNFEPPLSSSTVEPVISEESKSEPISNDDDVELETLFDPMDQVELLDPNYEQKQQEKAGLDLKSAISIARETITTLSNRGFKVDSEEIDLDNEYKIIIKITKNQ